MRPRATEAASCSELGRVEEAEDPRHRELRHGKEEGAEEGDRHHQVEIDEEIRAELREALRTGRGRGLRLQLEEPSCAKLCGPGEGEGYGYS